MCGIGGAVNARGGDGLAWVDHINRLQAHRGPDDAVGVDLGSTALGNTRLAIQDPTPDGNQPFRSSDGRFVAVFNGEIYNYRELTTKYGLKLTTQCDGAVIPEMWSRIGSACLREFRGMYAIAVADTQTSRITIARDQLGIKPLYWTRMPAGAIAFASEPRSLAGLRAGTAISQETVSRFLYLGALGADESPFIGIHSVPPDGVVTFDVDGGVRIEGVGFAGSRGHIEPASMSEADLAREFRTSVDLHLRSDVPTALLLSAGIDSSALACAAADLGKSLHCLTVVGNGLEDESSVAAATARHYGHEHQGVEATLTRSDISDFVRQMQRPTIDGLNTYLVSKAVQQAGFKVALSGLGGDEALAGYSHARLLRWLRPLRYWRRTPAQAQSLALKLARLTARGAASGKLARLVGPQGPDDAWQLSLLQRELFSVDRVTRMSGVNPATLRGVSCPPELESVRTHRALAAAEIRLYMQSMLLPDADAFSMARSVELRVPFVDPPFLDAALAVGDRVGQAFTKATLVHALGDPHLVGLLARPKSGFAVPMRTWMTGGEFDDLLAQARDRSAPLWDYVDADVGQRILADVGGRRWSEPWSLCILNAWLLSV